jgi:hypothetical protein
MSISSRRSQSHPFGVARQTKRPSFALSLLTRSNALSCFQSPTALKKRSGSFCLKPCLVEVPSGTVQPLGYSCAEQSPPRTKTSEIRRQRDAQAFKKRMRHRLDHVFGAVHITQVPCFARNSKDGAQKVGPPSPTHNLPPTSRLPCPNCCIPSRDFPFTMLKDFSSHRVLNGDYEN